MLPDFNNDIDLTTPLTEAEVAQWFLGEQQAAALSVAQTGRQLLMERLLVIEESLAALKAAVEFSSAQMNEAKKHFLDPYCPKQKKSLFLHEFTMYSVGSLQGIRSVMQNLDEHKRVRINLQKQDAVIDELTKSMQL